MSSYQPKIDEALWERLRPFVFGIVDDADGLTTYDQRQLYAVVTPLAVWMHTQAGLPLERDVALDPRTIDRFVMAGLAHYTKAGRGTMRSRLRRLSETLEPGLSETPRERALGKSQRSRPYSDEAITSLHSWAHSLPQQPRLNANRLLALGFGAGLIGTEFGRLRVEDLELRKKTVIVHVTGTHIREVPVLAEWEKALVECVLAGSRGYVFRIGRQTTHRNVITNFVERHCPPLPLQARRMRATWMVRHLQANTPVIALLAASGLTSAEGLDPFLQWVEPPADNVSPLRLA